MSRAAVNTAGVLATLLLLLVPLTGQYQHASTLAAFTAALALVTAAMLCARVALLAHPAEATHAGVAAWMFARDAAFQTQHGPNAAGKPRPRAPGANPRTD